MTGNPLLDLALPEMDAGQRRIHPLMKTAVMQRDHRVCRYCGARATEIDHVEPWAHGGLTVLSNLVASCQPCNRSKGDRTPEEWRRDQATAKLVAAMKHRRTRRGRIEANIRQSRQPAPASTFDQLLRAASQLQRQRS